MNNIPQNNQNVEIYPLGLGRFVVARRDEPVAAILERIRESMDWIPFQGEPVSGPEPVLAWQEVI